MSIYTDDFDGGGGGEGSWKDFGAAPLLSSGGNPNNCVLFGANMGYYRDLDNTYISTRFSFSLKVASGFRTFGQLINLKNVLLPDEPNAARPIVWMQFEPDQSISVYISGLTIPLFNTQTLPKYVITADEWLNVQWVVVMGIALDDDFVSKVTVKSSLGINGVAAFEDIEHITDIAVSSLAAGLGSNHHVWTATGQGNTFVDNIVVEAASSLESAASIQQAFAGKMILETVELPVDALVIASQLVIEDIELPTSSPCIVTQMVIELVGKIVVPSNGGWNIYEA